MKVYYLERTIVTFQIVWLFVCTRMLTQRQWFLQYLITPVQVGMWVHAVMQTQRIISILAKNYSTVHVLFSILKRFWLCLPDHSHTIEHLRPHLHVHTGFETSCLLLVLPYICDLHLHVFTCQHANKQGYKLRFFVGVQKDDH